MTLGTIRTIVGQRDDECSSEYMKKAVEQVGGSLSEGEAERWESVYNTFSIVV